MGREPHRRHHFGDSGQKRARLRLPRRDLVLPGASPPTKEPCANVQGRRCPRGVTPDPGR